MALILTGCPGGDGTSDTGETGADPTETSATETGPGEATSDPTNDPTDAMTSGMSGNPSTGDPPADCDPPCEDGEVCVEGTCMGASDSTGQPTECGTNFTTEDPACDQCWKDNCCTELQACWGDETQMGSTPCSSLDACINESCLDAMDLMSLQMCVDESCPELAGEVNLWYGVTLCGFTNCDEICNPPMG